MSNSSSAHPTVPPTVWLARGRHIGPSAEDVLRRTLRQHKDSGVIDDHQEVPHTGDSPELTFEARWRVRGAVTVRARITVGPFDSSTGGQDWALVAEAESPWDLRWPSPATMFWPGTPEATWDHEAAATELRFRDLNPLPSDDKAMKRLLKSGARDTWGIHVVVHEAMTPDERGLTPLAELLPPGLRHRVVEHRAAPHQLRSVNWALDDLGVRVPRGGAVVLPGIPAPHGYDGDDFAVRSVFLDGSQPTELIEKVTGYAVLPRPFPEGAEAAVTALREDWRLLRIEEELARERKLVAMYAEALDAMTKSRDLYREAAEQAHEALAAYRESSGAVPEERDRPGAPTGSPLQQLSRTFDRLKGANRRPRS